MVIEPKSQLEKWLKSFHWHGSKQRVWDWQHITTPPSHLCRDQIRADLVKFCQYPMPLEAKKGITPHIDQFRTWERLIKEWLTYTLQYPTHIPCLAHCLQIGNGILSWIWRMPFLVCLWVARANYILPLNGMTQRLGSVANWHGPDCHRDSKILPPSLLKLFMRTWVSTKPKTQMLTCFGLLQ